MPSAWARLALIVLLALSLALKAWRLDAADDRIQQPRGSVLIGVLSASGFAVAEENGLESPAWVGTRGDCRIEVTTISPLGWHQSAVAARAGDQALAYVYDRKVYREQPLMLTKLGYYWHRLANYFQPSAVPPVFAVMSSAGCAGQSIDALLLVRQVS